MIFKEVIEQILFERGIDHKELASELGISFLQVENLRTGISKKPNDRIYNKIVDYCQEHSIEIDINWNDVLYDIFITSDWNKDYLWIRDLNDDGYVLLKHKWCGKHTLVPLNAFGSKSTPCIHCWVDKYVSPDSYTVNLSEYDYNHEFRHKCGHTYSVTYEEIKQKKFRCPVCSGYRYNYDNLNRHSVDVDEELYLDDFVESTSFDNSYWNTELKQRLEKIANERGFSIEEKGTPYCAHNYSQMTDSQFVLVCNNCFDSAIFEKDDSSVQGIIEFANTHANQCENTNYRIIESTKTQSIIWISDLEKILYMTALKANEYDPVAEIIRKIGESDYTKKVYIAHAGDMSDDRTTFLFFHFYDENDSSNYYNLLTMINPNNFGDMSFLCFPNKYLANLYEEIIRAEETEIYNSNKLQQSCDDYIDIVNFFKQNTPEIYLGASFAKAIGKFGDIVNKTSKNTRDESAERIFNIQKCPVCSSLYRSNKFICTDCGFEELNKVFINKDEYELWFNEVVVPARKKRENNS